MKLNEVYKKSDDIASRIVDGEAVLVTASTGTVTVLNEVGSIVWDNIDGVKTLEQLAHLVQKEFDVDKEIAIKDCKNFMDELISKSLVENG